MKCNCGGSEMDLAPTLEAEEVTELLQKNGEAAENALNAQISSKRPKELKVVIFSILAVCLITTGCYYWYKNVYQPDERLSIAARLLDYSQVSEADEAYRAFISDYPQHAKVAFAYGKLFDLNFSDESISEDILKILQEKYPKSEEYANSLAKSAARKIKAYKPLYDYYYNTGYGKDKYYLEAKSLLNELNAFGDSSAFIAAGGTDLIKKLNEIVNPAFGAIEFKLALSDYINIDSVVPADKPKITLTRSDGTLIEVQYDQKTGIVSSANLNPGNYQLDINLTRSFGTRRGNYFGGESLTIIPGRKYKDTTYLFMKKKSDAGSDNIDQRYLNLVNNTQVIVANQITPSSDSPVPTKITVDVLPNGYRIPANDHYLFDLDNNTKNELIAYYLKTRSLAILQWNGKSFEEQSKFQIGNNDSKLDYPMFPISIRLFNLEGISFPVLGLITTSGESGSYPELTLLTWNGIDGYNIIWDATAGDHGEWQLSNNKIIMSQENFSVRAQADANSRFTQEYEYNGTTFVLANAYTSKR
ncbi:hypothetical protein [Desulfosporosinus meridiei]|nr:hypothetical protein [Desulfosporosinus meridiei]